MALMGINLRAHEGDWEFEAVKKKMQISIQERGDHAVVPFPNYVSRSRFDSLRANVAWNSQFWNMSICDHMLREYALQILLAQFGAVHAYRVVPDVYQCANRVGFSTEMMPSIFLPE